MDHGASGGVGREDALAIAEAMISGFGEMVVLVDQIVELEHGWVVFYESAGHVKSRNEEDRLMGNGPIFVDRTGRAAVLGTALPWREMLDRLLIERERQDA